MRSDDDGTEGLRRAHRVASDRVGDGPDARVRAAVLAAAARGVDARPRAVSSEAPSNPLPTRRPRRWTASAAALLVVSIATGVVATHLMRESPVANTTVASSLPVPRPLDLPAPAESPAAVAAMDIAPKSMVASADGARRAEQRSREAPRPEQRVARPSRESAAIAAPARPEVQSRVASPVSEPAAPLFVPSPPVAAPGEAAPPASRKTETTTADQGPTTAPAFAAPATMRSAPRPDAARNRIGRAVEPPTPEAWVDRIFKLRAAGNDFEADREVEALRARYPAFTIPPAVLGGTGSR